MIEKYKTNHNNSHQDEIKFKELFSLLWAGRKLIIIATSFFAVCSIFYALSLSDYYKSHAVVSLAKAPGEGSSFSGMSGLASIAGINVSSGEEKGALVINTVRSRAFLKHLLSIEDVLPSLMADESYDSESKKLVFKSNIYDAVNKKWLETQPSYLKTYNVYMGQVSIDYNALQRLIFLSVEHKSPIFAKKFMDLIIREADAKIRQIDFERSSDALAYLTTEISKTSLIEMRSSINQLIMSQLETQMMTQISSNYILNVIEPPYIPEIKSKPSRSLICLFGTVLGLVIGIVSILTRHYYALNTAQLTSKS